MSFLFPLYPYAIIRKQIRLRRYSSRLDIQFSRLIAIVERKRLDSSHFPTIERKESDKNRRGENARVVVSFINDRILGKAENSIVDPLVNREGESWIAVVPLDLKR